MIGSQPSKSLYPDGHCWVFDFVSKKFATVNRSSFAAELRNSLEAAQAGMLCNSFIEENLRSGLSAIDLVHAQESADYQTPLIVVGDNDGVFKTVTAQNPKATTEPVLTPHVRAFRELLDKKVIKELIWADNRDMVADPLTKGKTRRNVLNTGFAKWGMGSTL